MFMIGAGILLFLSNLGYLPIRNVWDYWPPIFVAIGLGRLTGTKRPGGLIVGVLFVVTGVVFTLVNTGIFRLRVHDDSWPLSLVFLALGIGGLAQALDGGKGEGRRRHQGFSEALGLTGGDASPSTDPDTSPVVHNFALMASVNQRVESSNLRGGSLTSLLGSIEVDLRRSHFAEGSDSIVVDANAVLGSVKLRVPETWRVIWNGAQVMGNFQDKTVPPLAGSAAPQLILTGYIFMGTIEVES